MSEAQKLQASLSAEVEVYRQKGRVLELEADNARLLAAIDEGLTGTDISLAVRTVEEMYADNAALRLKVQELVKFYDKHVGTPCEQIRHQQEVEALNERLDAYHKDLTTLETLVKRLPNVKGELSVHGSMVLGNNPEVSSDMTHADEAQDYAALLTHRQGMEV